MSRTITAIKEFIRGRPLKIRSKSWPKVRSEFLAKYPRCAYCGGVYRLEAHHILPFHLFPMFELASFNLISLCEENHCHFQIGHLNNWRNYNERVAIDCEAHRSKVKLYV